MNPVLDITPLRSFVAVATCGGFHKAAATLHLTQSAVSQHVRRLESVTGKRLVERTGRIARFTADGEILLVEARRVLAAHDDAIMRMGALSESKVITVGATEYGADWALPFLSDILRVLCPDRGVHFRLDRSQRVRAAHAGGNIDVAVFHQPMVPGVTANGPVVAMRWLAAPDFVPDPTRPLPLLVFDEPCSTRGIAIDLLAAAGIDFSIVVESHDLAGIITAARAGLGVVLEPIVRRPPEGLRTVDYLPAAPDCALQVLFSANIPPEVQAATRAAFVAELNPDAVLPHQNVNDTLASTDHT